MKTTIFLIIILTVFACSSESSDPQPIQPLVGELPAAIDSAFSKEVYIEGQTTATTKFDVGLLVEWHKYYVARFYREAKEYGWGDLQRNNLIVGTRWSQTPEPCRAYKTEDGQIIILLSNHLSQDVAFIPFYRELAHMLLNKPYSTNPDEIMAPNFNKSFTARNFDEKMARPYLDKLFKK